MSKKYLENIQLTEKIAGFHGILQKTADFIKSRPFHGLHHSCEITK